MPFLQAPMSRGCLRAGSDGLPSTLHCLACRDEICSSQLLERYKKWTECDGKIEESWKDRGESKGESSREGLLASPCISSFLNLLFPHTPFSTSLSTYEPCATCIFIIPWYHYPWRSEENLYLQVHWWLFIYGRKCFFTKVSLFVHE